MSKMRRWKGEKGDRLETYLIIQVLADNCLVALSPQTVSRHWIGDILTLDVQVNHRRDISLMKRQVAQRRQREGCQ